MVAVPLAGYFAPSLRYCGALQPPPAEHELQCEAYAENPPPGG